MSTVVPSQSNIQSALRFFLTSVTPTGTEIIEGQDNMVPEPKGSEFVVMTIIRQKRLATNNDSYADCAFWASIIRDIMTVENMQLGVISLGRVLLGVGILDGTIITEFITGTGLAGTYRISRLHDDLSVRVLASGVKLVMQPTEITVQLDVHSEDIKVASDMASAISTLFRDDYACEMFAATGYDVSPLYADDPRQMQFLNESMQSETRYIVEAHLQANQLLTPTQQFLTAIKVGLINVDAKYPT